MWSFFDLLCHSSAFLIILFTGLSYATGLFYLAELSEEFPTRTRQLIRGVILTLLALHTLALVFTKLSPICCLIGIAAHLIYYRLLSFYPDIPLQSKVFLASLLLLCASQIAWYSYFKKHIRTSLYQSNLYPGQPLYSLSQCLSFCLLFVWLTPLIFFISASVGDNVLPTGSDAADNSHSPLAKSVKPKHKSSDAHRVTTSGSASLSSSGKTSKGKTSLMSVFRICRKQQQHNSSKPLDLHSPAFRALNSPAEEPDSPFAQSPNTAPDHYASHGGAYSQSQFSALAHSAEPSPMPAFMMPHPGAASPLNLNASQYQHQQQVAFSQALNGTHSSGVQMHSLNQMPNQNQYQQQQQQQPQSMMQRHSTNSHAFAPPVPPVHYNAAAVGGHQLMPQQPMSGWQYSAPAASLQQTTVATHSANSSPVMRKRAL